MPGATPLMNGANPGMGTSASVAQVTAAGSGASLFTTQTPSLAAVNDGHSLELGMKFQSNAAGTITAIRYWRSASETGSHTGSIWSSTGAQLASVAFTGETASGWQLQALASPLAITANTTYVVSVNVNTAYVDTRNALATSIVNGNLSSVADGNDGAYVTPSGLFPTMSYENSNYFRDVVFTTSAASPTPPPGSTPPPTTTLNCASNPHACGYPDATNTGVPPGTALTSVGPNAGQLSSGNGWHYDSRGWVIADGAGAVLDSLDLNNIPIVVIANNVTIQRCNVHDVTGESAYAIAVGQNVAGQAANNVTIQDSSISGHDTGSGRVAVAINQLYNSSGMKVLRSNIFYADTGIQPAAGNALIQDSYIHDMGFSTWPDSPNGDHVNGITMNGGSGLTVEHNTIFNQVTQTDAVSLFQDFGKESNDTIDNNLLAGGGYTIYGGDGSKGKTSYIRITNNRISTIFFPNGGYWGWLAYYSSNRTGNVLTGNVMDNTGLPAP